MTPLPWLGNGVVRLLVDIDRRQSLVCFMPKADVG